MKTNSIIPDRIVRIEIKDGEYTVLDTKGLDCILKAVGGKLRVSLENGKDVFYTLSDGEKLDFCGRVLISGNSGTAAEGLMYRTL